MGSCRPALELISDYGQDADTLLHCDPPYLGSTRSANYRHEMTSRSEHVRLAEALHDASAAVVLSGYPSSLYDELYRDWHRHRLDAWTGNGIRNGHTKADGGRVEMLWSNRPFPGSEHLF